MRYLTVAWVALVGSALLVVTLTTAVSFAGPLPFAAIWEDSLMYARYAEELLRHKGMVWNPDGPPTYGLTSPDYLLVGVLPAHALMRGSPLTALLVANLISGALFLTAAVVLVFKAVTGPRLPKRIALALVAISLAGSAKHFSVHLVSGMETCFAMLYFTLYILILKWQARSERPLPAMLAGVAGGLAFGVRPDLLVFTFLIPIACLVLARQPARRLTAMLMLAATVVVLAAQMAWAHAYFHSALPLSFYVKAFSARTLYPRLTGDSANQLTAWGHLAFFLISYWALFFTVALDVGGNAARWWRAAPPEDKGLLAGLVVYLAYFAALALPLMPGHQRFYYPALPALIYLTGSSLVRLTGRLPSDWYAPLGRMPSRYRYFAIAAAFSVPLPFLGDLHLHDLYALAHGNFASLDLTLEYRTYWKDYWLGLDRISAMPPDLVIATTEYGHVAAMNPDKQVIDMSGLNDSFFARQPFSATVLFERYRPDLIYMPHPDFAGMIEELKSNPTFIDGYTYITNEEGLDVALRRDSRYYASMLAIAAESRARK